MNSGKKRLYYLDFVRVISMLIIVFFHFNISVDAHMIYSGTLSRFNSFASGNLAHVGVGVFFIVSGIGLVYANSNDGYSIKKFYKKRFLSIYPYFWVAYLLVYVYCFLKFKTSHPFTAERNPFTFIFTIIGMDGYLTPLGTNFYLIGEWFLGCIIIMYILYPIMLKLINSNIIITSLVFFISVSIILYSCNLKITLDQNVIFRLTQFYTGMCIGKLVLLDNNWARYFHIALALISISGMVLMYMYEIPMKNGSVVNIYLIGIFSYGILSLIGELVMRIEMIKKIVIWMSKISFTLYLLHHVISEQIICSFEGVVLSKTEVINLFLIVIGFDIIGGLVLKKLVDYLLAKRNNKLEGNV